MQRLAKTDGHILLRGVFLIALFPIVLVTYGCNINADRNRVELHVEANRPGAPQLIGIPFPKGELKSPDHVRLLNTRGRELPAQVTEVSTWAPTYESIKWIWVFFFTEEEDNYILEYGDDIHRTHQFEQEIAVTNNQREGGYVEVDTGPLRFRISQGLGGFFEKVELDYLGDGFDEKDIIARGDTTRGSFLDILDDHGIDPSQAVVTRTFKEKGSGPLHSIIRVEGEYRYNRDDNNPSPFVMRIHSYAGKSYVRVFHTLTYTGDPDKHKKVEGEYGAIATDDENIVDQEELKGDAGWTQPNDRIAKVGLSLNYNLSDSINYTTAFYDGSWWDPGKRILKFDKLGADEEASLFQTGPKPTGIPPVPNSTDEKRLTRGFKALMKTGSNDTVSQQRVPGWIDVSDEKWGVSVGIRHFFEEYPKELVVNQKEQFLTAFVWSPDAGPMSFERSDRDFDSGMLANFAQGLTKTTELVYNFHKGTGSPQEIEEKINYVLDPPVSHADPEWYAASEVFGKMAAGTGGYDAFERGLDYKFKWWLFNQQWEPWYGMFNYGDGKSYYFNDDWHQWTNNEPGNDYMWWLQFTRTGNRDYYLAGQAASEHTMDVDNIHWPTFPEYYGATNDAVDAYRIINEPPGTPYLGMGRRHASQHWTSLLSAHVWTMGWIASYYIDGNHRGLEVAEQTGDYYIRRVFGIHGLRGRRLYLSVWNLSEIWDATKKEKYYRELKDRVDIMLELQKDANQGGELVINRYGYAQVYASHGLRKYYQMTGNEDVREALITHARRIRDVPPLNHQMESYLSSIHSLLVGYEFTGEKSLLDEALHRAQVLKADKLKQELREYETQKALARALEQISRLPDDPTTERPPIWKFTNGLRIFGWTHIYNVPYLEYWMDKKGYEPSSK